MTVDQLMVGSFLMAFLGGYIGLVWLVDKVIEWMIDNGLLWWAIVPVGVVALMMNLSW